MDNAIREFSPRQFIKTRVNTFLIMLLTRMGRDHLKNGKNNLASFAYDDIGHTITVEGMYENTELGLIAEWLKKNNLIRGAAIDAGANIGNHTIFFSNIYKKVFAIEPNPNTLHLLRFNVDLFTKNVEIMPIALSDKDGCLLLELRDKTNIGSSYIKKKEFVDRGGAETVEVKGKQIDDLTELAKQEIGLIKIDVEGFELEVLNGGVKLIERDKPVILFEQHKEDFVDGSSKVIDFLKNAGYSFFYFKHTPHRAGNLKKITRLANWTRGLLFGSRCEIVECKKFTADFYNMIIAVQI